MIGVVFTQAKEPSSAHLAIWRNGKRLGFATVNQRLLPDGGKYVIERLQLGSGAKGTKVTIESSFSADGSPVRKVQETTAPGTHRRVVVTFGDDGARVVVFEGAKNRTETVPLVAGAPRKDVAELWFLRGAPKPKASVKAYVFDPSSLEWQLRETTYVGPTKGGNHEMRSEFGGRKMTVVVDSIGLPVRIDDGETRMERVNPLP